MRIGTCWETEDCYSVCAGVVAEFLVILAEPMPVTFSAGSPKRAPKTPPKPVIKESPKKVPNLII